MFFYAGLDVGGTSGRVKFADENSNVIGEYVGVGCAYNTEGFERGREKYSRLMHEALSEYGLKSSDCIGICIAASGIDSDAQAAQVKSIFEELGFDDRRILAVNDCEIFLRLSEGAVLVSIAGTGCICCGRSESGKIFRTGGWNHILSDEGSAYDIGLQSVKALADHLDGRISCPVLAKRIGEVTGIDSLEKADEYVNRHLLDKSPVGALSRVCAQAAEEGDASAEAIIRSCAAKAFSLVFDTGLKLEGKRPGRLLRESAHDETLNDLKADLWLWGSVNVKNDMFRAEMIDLAAKRLPGVSVKLPDRPALDIALEAAKTF